MAKKIKEEKKEVAVPEKGSGKKVESLSEIAERARRLRKQKVPYNPKKPRGWV